MLFHIRRKYGKSSFPPKSFNTYIDFFLAMVEKNILMMVSSLQLTTVCHFKYFKCQGIGACAILLQAKQWAVWPDDRIKSCPYVCTSCPESSHGCFTLNIDDFYIAPYNGYFCWKKFLPRTFKNCTIWSHWQCSTSCYNYESK